MKDGLFRPQADSRAGNLTPLSASPNFSNSSPQIGNWSVLKPESRDVLERSRSEELLLTSAKAQGSDIEEAKKTVALDGESGHPQVTSSQHPAIASSSVADRSNSPPPLSITEAVNRAVNLSKKLSGSNIPTHVTETGDLMLDMTGYKSSEDEALRAELVARKILAEELEGNYDIGALIGADEHGNLWIYSSEEAKEAATQKHGLPAYGTTPLLDDAASDPGYHSDEDILGANRHPSIQHQRRQSELPSTGLVTPPHTPPDLSTAGDPNRNYAKTLRLTSGQLQALRLKPGANTMSFSVNRATCQAYMYYWAYNVPVVISDIDGTITK